MKPDIKEVTIFFGHNTRFKFVADEKTVNQIKHTMMHRDTDILRFEFRHDIVVDVNVEFVQCILYAHAHTLSNTQIDELDQEGISLIEVGS